MPKRIVAIDTEVVIIAAGGHTPIAKGKDRALQMLRDHMNAGDHVYIPAPAFAECCHEIKGAVLQQLRVAPLNATGAQLANQITRKVRTAAKKGRSKSNPTRQELKLDALILATAEALRADILYIGADTWFRTAKQKAKLKIDVRELPPLTPQQLKLKKTR